jgi:hypothetical protein
LPRRRGRRTLPSYALHRCQTAILAHPPDPYPASGITIRWAKKRISGFATTANNRIRANTPASPDRIRENPPIHYDDASDAGVGAKSEAGANATDDSLPFGRR